MSDQVQVSNEFKHNAFALKKKKKCFHNQQSSNVLKESSWKWNKSSKETWQQMDTSVLGLGASYMCWYTCIIIIIELKMWEFSYLMLFVGYY